MQTTPIRANDSIVIAAPASKVWQILVDVGGYPQWWPRSLGVRVHSIGKDPRGAEIELRPIAVRPFRCRVEEIVEMKSIRVRYVGGLIEGTGEWRLEPADHGTRVIYHLDVLAHGWLVGLIGRIVNLSRIHSRSMHHVFLNLEKVSRERSSDQATLS